MPLRLSLLLAEQALVPQPPLTGLVLQLPNISVALSLNSCWIIVFPVLHWNQNWMQHSTHDLTSVVRSGAITLLHLPAVLLLIKVILYTLLFVM